MPVPLGLRFQAPVHPERILDRDRTAFYQAIQSVRGADLDLTGWLEYFVRGLATQLAEVVDLGRRTIRADIASRQHNLNPRQEQALEHLASRGQVDIATFQMLLLGRQPAHIATRSRWTPGRRTRAARRPDDRLTYRLVEDM